MTTPNLKRYVSRQFDRPTIIGDDGSGGGGYINEIDVDENFDRHLRRQVGRFEVNSPPPRQNYRRHDRGGCGGGGGGGGVKRGVDNDGFVIVNLDRDDTGSDTVERNNVMNAAYPVLSTPPSKPPTINGPAALSSQGDDELSLEFDEETSAGNQRRKNIIFATSIKQEKLNKFHGVSFEQTNEDDPSYDETKQKPLSGQSDKSDGKQEDEEVEDPWHDCLVWTLIGLTCLLVLAACYMAIYLYWLWPSLSDPLTLYAVQKTIVEFVVFVLAVLFVNSLIILRIFP